jgi:hypothetical protein
MRGLMAVESILDALTLADSAICHQSVARGLYGNAAPLPLCARCVGLHLGLWAGLLWWRLQRPLPPRPSGAVLAALGVAVAATALNVGLAAAHLSGDPAWIRVLIGAALGYALSGIAAPLLGEGRVRAQSEPATIREVVHGALRVLVVPGALALAPGGPWVVALSLPVAVVGLASLALFWFVALGVLPGFGGRVRTRTTAAAGLAAAQVAATLALRGTWG